MANFPSAFGGIETHAGLLTRPDEGQELFKLMKIEHMLNCLDHSYLFFNRIDSYSDFPGADAHDGEQLPLDRSGNASAKFAKDPSYAAEHYYDESRRRTYACCFAMKNLDFLWSNYAGSVVEEKLCIVFAFEKLRARINSVFAQGAGVVTADGVPCEQIFHVNYGVVQYVEWTAHQANLPHLPHPLEYAHLKDLRFREETEMRITLSALGFGRFVCGGQPVEFPVSLRVPFEFRAAIADGTIKELLFAPESDQTRIATELAKRHISTTMRCGEK